MLTMTNKWHRENGFDEEKKVKKGQFKLEICNTFFSLIYQYDNYSEKYK
jgi:hypothetical protein